MDRPDHRHCSRRFHRGFDQLPFPFPLLEPASVERPADPFVRAPTMALALSTAEAPAAAPAAVTDSAGVGGEVVLPWSSSHSCARVPSCCPAATWTVAAWTPAWSLQRTGARAPALVPELPPSLRAPARSSAVTRWRSATPASGAVARSRCGPRYRLPTPPAAARRPVRPSAPGRAGAPGGRTTFPAGSRRSPAGWWGTGADVQVSTMLRQISAGQGADLGPT